MTALSILELVRVTQDTDAGTALNNARDLASHAEEWGYGRIWVAEHHNMAGIASAATSIVIAHIAGGTRTIRVGAGGIMLPNHAPYIIAVPAAGTNVPLWILGSSNFGAMLAAEFGLPYAFASHFAPDLLLPALDIYRSRFKPSEQLDRPYAMAGINIIAADTDAEAKRLATTQQMSFADIFSGRRGLSRPPIDDIETYWSPNERAQALRMLERSVVGSVHTVRSELQAFIAETGVDEVMIVSDVYDHQARLRSIELIAEAMKP
jgi:alkanesulfonate monooxygenase SsuD/methylene tetrahydromethanopterin reductase-like flavin-dependent oxidoreductase (luciferase family)